MKRHFFIFFCFVLCVLVNASAFGDNVCSYDVIKNWKPGNQDISNCSDLTGIFSKPVPPIWAAMNDKDGFRSNTGYTGNPEAVEEILKVRPSAAKEMESVYPNRTALHWTIENCCVKGTSTYPNRTSDIVKIIIKYDPESKNEIYHNLEKTQFEPDTKVLYHNKSATMLDYVRYVMKFEDSCKKTKFFTQCKEIEKILIQEGVPANEGTDAAKGYWSASETPVTTEPLKTDEQVKSIENSAAAGVTLVATDTQNTKKKKWFQGELLRAFYEEAGLSGSAKQESDKALNAWKQNCLTEGISTGAHVRKTEVKKDPSHKTRYIELITKEKNKDSSNHSYYDAELDFLNNFNGTVWGCRVAECDPGYKEAETVISYPFCEEDKSSSTAPAATGTTATETATPDDTTKSGDMDTKTSSVSISDAQGNQGNKTDARSEEEKRKAMAEKQKAYDDAKAKEQSTANKLLGGLSTAATGIGGMQALQGMAEQSADKDAAADMAAYIETMRCTYGDGKQVKAGPDEIELPGANDQELMNLRAEYLALAADLKERKAALGMKPGIESEVIMDRSQTGLYDDENIGITGGNYESIYRAMMLGSEADQAKIDDAAKTSANRVKYGAIAVGAGVVGGIVGNQLINGKSSKEKEETKALDKEKKLKETPQKQAEKQTEKEANNKEKTQTQENNSLLAEESLNRWALGATGKCFSPIDESPLEDGKCGGFLTEKGSWWVSFPYGIVYGESKCGPSESSIKPCLCRITNIQKLSEKTKWKSVQTNWEEWVSIGNCEETCAKECASYVAYVDKVREKLYNKKILNFFKNK